MCFQNNRLSQFAAIVHSLEGAISHNFRPSTRLAIVRPQGDNRTQVSPSSCLPDCVIYTSIDSVHHVTLSEGCWFSVCKDSSILILYMYYVMTFVLERGRGGFLANIFCCFSPSPAFNLLQTLTPIIANNFSIKHSSDYRKNIKIYNL